MKTEAESAIRRKALSVVELGRFLTLKSAPPRCRFPPYVHRIWQYMPGKAAP